jgi:hypothetical protein
MRKLVAVLLLSAGMAVTSGFTPASHALAQPAPGAPVDALAQMELTDQLIQQYLEAQPDIDAAMGQAGEQESDKPDPKVLAKLEDIAKKHKFANFGQFDAVAGNIALVLEGVDPKAKKYIGAEPEIKQEIAALQANNKIAAADKKQEIAELNDELKSITPVKFKVNIELVLKYFDKLAAEEPEQPK